MYCHHVCARVVCATLLLIPGAGRCLAAEPQPLPQRIDELAQPYLDSGLVVGMTIGVLQHDKETIVGYGRLSTQGDQKPDADTLYEIGSVTKVFTGVLLADAVVAGRMRLDQPAQAFLPPGVTMPSLGDRAITLQHLSTHVSGLPRLPSNFPQSNPENPYADYSGKRLCEFLNAHQLQRSPGEKSEYSNLAVGLLGKLLAREAQSTYPKLLRDRITKPLNLASTTTSLTEEQEQRLAQPHHPGGAPATTWDFDALAGAGAIRSSTRDMLRFARANLNPPEGPTGRAIKLAWQQHQAPIAEGDFALGLGWHIAHDGSTRWHNGQTGGYHSTLYASKPLNAAVVVLANTGAMQLDLLGEDLIGMLAGQDVPPRTFEKLVYVPPNAMKKLTGRYQLAPGAEFRVTLEDNRLMVQLTGQQAYQVFPRSENEWFYRVVDATLTFTRSKSGRGTSVELFQNGIRQTAKRVR